MKAAGLVVEIITGGADSAAQRLQRTHGAAALLGDASADASTATRRQVLQALDLTALVYARDRQPRWEIVLC